MQTTAPFLERYPEFLLHMLSVPWAPAQDLLSPAEEAIKLPPDHAEILYVYGIGRGDHYTFLKTWLKEKRERRLVFLEDEFAKIQALIDAGAQELFVDPQVVIQWIPDPSSEDSKLHELVALFPTDRIAVTGVRAYTQNKRRTFRRIRLELLRRSTVAHALLTETLYSHRLLENLIRTIRRWPTSFLAGGLKAKFQGIPAVICGAGPSLQESIPWLKELEDKALILAGGSTLAALSHHGVHPHLGLALDPNPEEFERLKVASCYETPLIYASRLQPDVFNALSGQWGYLVTATGGPFESHFERHVGLEQTPIGPELGIEAMSVTTLAIALAVEMGCNPILLNGIDLAYTGMRRYADGVMPSSKVDLAQMRSARKASEQMLRRRDIQGHYVHTLVKWVMESDVIGAFAADHPAVRFVNVSTGGIGFPGIPNRSFADEDFATSYDLRGLVHAEIQKLKMLVTPQEIEQEIESIRTSLQRLKGLAEEIIAELQRAHETKTPPSTGMMALLTADFEQEKAFESLFPLLGPALDKLFSRAFFASPDSSEEEKEHLQVGGKLAKWTHWKHMIDSALGTVLK